MFCESHPMAMYEISSDAPKYTHRNGKSRFQIQNHPPSQSRSSDHGKYAALTPAGAMTRVVKNLNPSWFARSSATICRVSSVSAKFCEYPIRERPGGRTNHQYPTTASKAIQKVSPDFAFTVRPDRQPGISRQVSSGGRNRRCLCPPPSETGGPPDSQS